MRVLDNTNLFDQKYSKSSALAGGTAGFSLGSGTAAVIVGVSAHASTSAAISAAAAATTAMETVSSSIPLVGGLIAKGTGLTAAAASANAAIAGAGMAGAVAALPVAIPVALGVFFVTGIVVSHNKKTKIQKNVGIEDLAKAVADFVFLPVCGFANSLVSKDPSYICIVKESVERQMRNWGYSMDFISKFLKMNLLQSSEEQIVTKYNSMMYALLKSSVSEKVPSCNLPSTYLKKYAKKELEVFRKELMI